MERFEAELQAFGNGAAMEVPLDVPGVFGGKRVPVMCRVNDVEFRTTIAVYGGRYYVGFNQEVRDRIGAVVGERLTVEIDRDELPRNVELPPELAAVLSQDPELQRRFDSLSYTHRKEYASWVAEAVRSATRARRAARAAEMLRGPAPPRQR